MTTKDFLIEKNRIVFERTGSILIPEDQIEETAFAPLTYEEDDENRINSDSYICPYCILYRNKDKYKDYEYRMDDEDIIENQVDCEQCPMVLVDNHCDFIERQGSYRKTISANFGNYIYTIVDISSEFQRLIEKYNEEMGLDDTLYQNVVKLRDKNINIELHYFDGEYELIIDNNSNELLRLNYEDYWEVVEKIEQVCEENI